VDRPVVELEGPGGGDRGFVSSWSRPPSHSVSRWSSCCDAAERRRTLPRPHALNSATAAGHGRATPHPLPRYLAAGRRHTSRTKSCLALPRPHALDSVAAAGRGRATPHALPRYLAAGRRRTSTTTSCLAACDATVARRSIVFARRRQ